ncbi:hypothetical protein C8Q77DRAFT_1119491 [Trametes polyzona]|nr:hypothetical protein C8Q77DRAFT_1119491 [Trametes polyzona]
MCAISTTGPSRWSTSGRVVPRPLSTSSLAQSTSAFGSLVRFNSRDPTVLLIASLRRASSIRQQKEYETWTHGLRFLGVRRVTELYCLALSTRCRSAGPSRA